MEVLVLFLTIHPDATIMDNGAISKSVKTDLPGIEVNYYYPRGVDLPQRTIYYRDED